MIRPRLAPVVAAAAIAFGAAYALVDAAGDDSERSAAPVVRPVKLSERAPARVPISLRASAAVPPLRAPSAPAATPPAAPSPFVTTEIAPAPAPPPEPAPTPEPSPSPSPAPAPTSPAKPPGDTGEGFSESR